MLSDDLGNLYLAYPDDDFPAEFAPGTVSEATLIATGVERNTDTLTLAILEMAGPIEARFDSFTIRDIKIP